MKSIHKMNIILLSSLTAAMMIGCGGGGDDGGGGGSTVESTLDAEAVEMLATRLIEMEICVATGSGFSSSIVSSAAQSSAPSSSGTSNGASSSSSVFGSSSEAASASISVSSSTAFSSSVITISSAPSSSAISSSSSSFNPFPAHSRAYEYDQAFNGTLGGTLNVHTYHSDGTTTLTFNLNDFANLLFGNNIALQGAFETVDHGTPGDFGPIVTNKTAQSKGPVNGTVDSTSRADTATNFSLEFGGYNQVYATQYMQPDSVTLASAVLTNKDENKKFSLTNAKADAVMTSGKAVVSNLSATFTDADIGTLQITQDSEAISVDLFEMYGGIPMPTYVEGSVELTATDGTKAIVEIKGTTLVISNVDDNGNKTNAKEMECQTLLPQ